MPAERWPDVFDRLIAFRRHIRRLFGVPIRAEIKANYLVRNGGDFRNLTLGPQARQDLYRLCMRLHPKLGLMTFAVVIEKALMAQSQPGRRVDEIAWEYTLQRLERFATKWDAGRGTHVLVVHDEGEAFLVRRLARKARRAGTAGSAFGTGLLRLPFARLVDDPVPRDSRQSYLLQLADLAAYAAYRKVHPPPTRIPTPVVPQSMWDELGQAAYRQANSLKIRPAPGLVYAP